jgi:hypothetical protein
VANISIESRPTVYIDDEDVAGDDLENGDVAGREGFERRLLPFAHLPLPGSNPGGALHDSLSLVIRTERVIFSRIQRTIDELPR